MIHKRFIFTFYILALLPLHSCRQGASLKQDQLATLKKEIVAGYAQTVYASYNEALKEAKKLDSIIISFTAKPNAQNLAAAKDQWIAARAVYAKTEAFRFYNGPIDNGETNLEPMINSWPLDEVYVDYVEGEAMAGIINNTKDFPDITKDILIKMNQQGGENNISTGYHAIEFLLWGQDLSFTGAGNRTAEDYIPGKNLNAERRSIYLQTVSQLLVEHLSQLVTAWKDNEKNYRYTFKQLPADEALEKIITGIAILSKVEMSGERMFTAYNNSSQEDEQSCFSDNTLNDLKNNLTGIERVYTNNLMIGYATIHSPSLSDLMEKTNPELGAKITTALTDAKQSLDAIPEPFDQSIIKADTRPLVLTAVKSMQHLGDLFSEAAEDLGLKVNTNAVTDQ